MRGIRSCSNVHLPYIKGLFKQKGIVFLNLSEDLMSIYFFFFFEVLDEGPDDIEKKNTSKKMRSKVFF